MRMAEYDHQSRHQPAGHDANFLDKTFLDPEEKLIGFLQQSTGRHCTPPPAVPAEVTFLLLDRLLEHGLRPTISAGPGGATRLRSRGIAQRAPAPRGRYQMHLAIECPLPPVLPHAIAHHHLRDVLIAALMHSVGPALQYGHGDDLHVEELGAIAKPRHALDECLTSTPRALSIFGEHLPHLVESSLCLQLHEAHLKGGR